MGSATDVCLFILGSTSKELDEYLGAEMPYELGHQKLYLVAGEEILEDLPGSGQAGTTRIYTALLRKISQDYLVEWLEEAPWNGTRAILICENDIDDVTFIKNFNREWPIETDLAIYPRERWYSW